MIKAANEIRVGDVMIIGGKRWNVDNVAPLAINKSVVTFRVVYKEDAGLYLAMPVDAQVNTYAGPLYSLSVSRDYFDAIKSGDRKCLAVNCDVVGVGDEIRFSVVTEPQIYVDVKVTDVYQRVCSFKLV